MRITKTVLWALLLTSTALVLCLTLATGRKTEAGVSSLDIGSASVAPGGQVTVSLGASAWADDGTLNGTSGDGLGNWLIDIAFDTGYLTNFACDVISIGANSICSSPSPGVVRFAGASSNGLAGGILLGTATFTAGDAAGVYVLDATIVTLTDPTGIDIQGITAGDGTITITQPTPSPTATPQPTPSPTPTPGPSLTPSPAPRRWGDVNCSGAADAVDALAILRKVGGLPVSQVAPCPTIGAVYP